MRVFIFKPSEVRIGGVSLRERQERMLRQLGEPAITLIFSRLEMTTTDSVLLLWGDTLFDPRIVQKLLAQSGNFIAVDGRCAQEWVGAAHLESHFFQSQSVANLNLTHTYHTHTEEKIKIRETIEFLSSVCKPLDISEMEDYVPKLRKNVPIYWQRIQDESDVRRAEKLLLASSEKDPSDVMAILHRPIENWVVVHLARTPITPNQVTLFVNILAWMATYLFATGNLIYAALLTFGVGLVDGFDGKLARLKGMVSKVGSLEHAFDLLFEFSWILALGYFLTQSEGLMALLLAGGIVTIVAFYRSIYDRYGQLASKSLDVAGRFENFFRRVAGRRNLFNIWILISVLVQAPIWALYAIFIHATVTALVYSISAWTRLRRLEQQ
jgi:phosphatidylglycerophosphate synthase